MYAMMPCKAKSENFTHFFVGYQFWAVTGSAEGEEGSSPPAGLEGEAVEVDRQC